jgi:hypothetical protein
VFVTSLCVLKLHKVQYSWRTGVQNNVLPHTGISLLFDICAGNAMYRHPGVPMMWEVQICERRGKRQCMFFNSRNCLTTAHILILGKSLCCKHRNNTLHHSQNQFSKLFQLELINIQVAYNCKQKRAVLTYLSRVVLMIIWCI